eukprot:CAMPEP_0175145732 /NCGR_PEP_ID=MMETSP0087-20121206/14951_1 /TAXON_ID=136419 /ORGANISM="Unknown Unknown, Strain D1" /LENGTH=1762 /DNA_ID=CAMNT_0016430545 /DNA_START=76 /DNA_END=5364 /DNA_ORIENTATION=+
MSDWVEVHKMGVVSHDYTASGNFQLSLTQGTKIMVIKEARGWYKCHKLDDPSTSGIFPISYVTLSGGNSEVKGPEVSAADINKAKTEKAAAEKAAAEKAAAEKAAAEKAAAEKAAGQNPPLAKQSSIQPLAKGDEDNDTKTMSAEVLLVEIDHSLRDWSESLRTHLVSGDVLGYRQIKERISALLELRRGFQNAKATPVSRAEYQADCISLIESSRKMQEGFMVPRKENTQVADTSNTSVIELVDLHRTMYASLKEEAGSASLNRARAKRKNKAKATLPQLMKMTSSPNLGRMSAISEEKFPEAGLFHLYLDVKMCLFQVPGEETELHFTLYNNTLKRFVTENYVVLLTEQGFPMNLDFLNKLQTFYTDLEPKDFNDQLWLVCRIYRHGPLLQEEKKKKASRKYKRPFGVAAMCVSNLGLHISLGQEFSPAPDAMTIFSAPNESLFTKLHELIIDGKQLDMAPKAKGIAIGLILSEGSLDKIRKKNPESMGETCVTQKTVFSTSQHTDTDRDDFFVKLEYGSFLQDKKKTAKNVLMQMHVVTDTGKVVEECISSGSGQADPETEYRSCVFYHSNHPTWTELIKLRIDNELISRCHLFFTFWHASVLAKKTTPFSIAWLPLSSATGMAVLPDNTYQVSTFKPFTKKENDFMGAFYLQGSDARLVPRKESLTLSTTLCSSKKTQNSTLHGLFHWKDHSSANVKQLLTSFIQIQPEEVGDVTKFVRETLDVFFALLRDKTATTLHEPALNALLHLLSLLTDKKLGLYHLVDNYIDTIFADAKVHIQLVTLCTVTLEGALQKPDEAAKRLCKCLKYVIKFVVASRQKDLATGSPLSEEELKAGVLNMLSLVNQLVALPVQSAQLKAVLFPAQAYLIRTFPDAIQELSAIVDAPDLATLARDMILAIPRSSDQTPHINFIRNLLEGSFGTDNTTRGLIADTIISTVKGHLQGLQDGSSLNEAFLCVDVLSKFLRAQSKADVLELAQKEEAGEDVKPQDVFKEKEQPLVELLPSLTHLVALIHKSTSGLTPLNVSATILAQLKGFEALVDTATVLMAILHSSTPEALRQLVAGMEKPALSQFLQDLLGVMLQNLQMALFPDMWIVMNSTQLATVLKVLLMVVESFATNFSKGDNFDHQLWQLYMTLALDFVVDERLRLEGFSQKKKLFITARHNDMRLAGIANIRQMWKVLGEKQVHLTDMLVARLYLMCTKEFVPIRQLAVDIYYDLVQLQYQNTGKLNDVEHHTIDSLYDIANMPVDVGRNLVHFFHSSLKLKFEANPNLKGPGALYLAHLNKMYDYMSRLLTIPDTTVHEDERTFVALEIMQYLFSDKEKPIASNRKQIYTQYVQYLVDLHNSMNNFVEAGITHLQQIRVLNWSDEIIGPVKPYPAEAEKIRKEKLYREAITCFAKGEDFERAITLSNELLQYYQFQTYDYANVTRVLTDQASYFKSISTTDRFYPVYFRIVYYGDGFDDEIRDKEFVYRGDKLESIMDFTNRFKRKFEKAKILMSSDPPSPEMVQEFSQIISITKLNTVSFDEADQLLASKAAQIQSGQHTIGERISMPRGQPGENLPAMVKQYWNNSDLRVFEYSKAVQKAKEKKPANEFKDLWVNRFYVFTAECFPANRRRQQVIARHEVSLTPIENAINSMLDKTEELKKLTAKVLDSPAGATDVGPLSMCLNGIIDAAVNGGTKLYIEAFLVPDFLTENPDVKFKDLQQELKDAIKTQVDSLDYSLDLFKSRCDTKLLGLYDHQKTKAQQMKEFIANFVS